MFEFTSRSKQMSDLCGLGRELKAFDYRQRDTTHKSGQADMSLVLGDPMLCLFLSTVGLEFYVAFPCNENFFYLHLLISLLHKAIVS